MSKITVKQIRINKLLVNPSKIILIADTDNPPIKTEKIPIFFTKYPDVVAKNIPIIPTALICKISKSVKENSPVK